MLSLICVCTYVCVCVCVCVCACAFSGVECTRPGNKFTLVHCEVLNSFDTEPGPKNESFVLGSSLAWMYSIECQV